MFKNNDIGRLRELAKQFKYANNTDLCKKILLIISAKTGTSNPRSDLSYSYIMREIKNDKEKLNEFMTVFKNTFDDAYENDLESPEEIALMTAMKAINFKDENES